MSTQQLRSSLPVFAFSCALAAGLFFNGSYGIQLGSFALSLGMCLLWLMLPLFAHTQQVNVPLSALGITLTLFWLWSGVTVFWSQAPLVSTLNVWWLGSLPIIYFGYMLHQDKERLWQQLQVPVLLIVVLLVCTGIYQLYVLGERPHSLFLNPNSHAALVLLVSLPLTGHLLQSLSSKHTGKYRLAILLAITGLCYFSLALSQSRGVILAFILMLILMYILLHRDIPVRHFTVVLALALCAYIAANLSVSGEVAQRLHTLSNPASAGSDRFIIWQQAWEMLKASPWIGIGTGMFWLLYPQYRDPSDGSGGLYVHNDYLQLWIETGVPGFLLLLAVLFITCRLLVHGIQSGRLTTPHKTEAVGLFAGMAAIAIHSFFTFNFYVLPILILLGAILARFHSLVIPATDGKVLELLPAQYLTPVTYRIILGLLFLFPVGYLGSTALASHYHTRGERLAQQGELQQADQALARAHQLSPLSDIILFARADLYRQSISRLATDSLQQRTRLYNDAHDLINEAIMHNGLRPHPYYVRGRLYQDNPALAGDAWQQQAEHAYATALQLDPLFYKARYEYARLLLKRGQDKQALELIQKGLAYQYPQHPELAPFLGLAARLMFEHHNTARGVELAHRVDQLIRKSGQKADFLDRMRQRYRLDLSGYENTK